MPCLPTPSGSVEVSKGVALEYLPRQVRRAADPVFLVCFAAGFIAGIPMLAYAGIVSFSYYRFGHKPRFGEPLHIDYYQPEIKYVIELSLLATLMLTAVAFVLLVVSRGRCAIRIHTANDFTGQRCDERS